ncbi:MAG: hypothetical protein ACO3JG_01355 [Luteolibacter sp.]
MKTDQFAIQRFLGETHQCAMQMVENGFQSEIVARKWPDEGFSNKKSRGF